MLSKIFAVTILVSLSTTAFAEDQFLCVGEVATGFRWDGNQWVTAKFKVDKDKYLVQEVPLENGVTNFHVKRLGESKVAHRCNRSPTSPTRIACGGLASGMLIDTEKLRFHELFGIGYVDGFDGPDYTPTLTIGTCTRVK